MPGFSARIRGASELPAGENQMSAQQLSVACLGLGRIGVGIAQSIQRAGHRLTVYNRTPEKAKSFSGSQTTIARTPREAASGADIVLTCLMDDKSVLENMLGENGMLAEMPQGAIHIGTSTVTQKAPSHFAKLYADHGSY